MHLSPPPPPQPRWLRDVRSKAVVVVVDSLFILTPVVGFCNCSMFCCALRRVHSSFAIISMGKTELVALLCLSSWCLVIVLWLFPAMPWVCLQFVIVVFPDHAHLLFLVKTMTRNKKKVRLTRKRHDHTPQTNPRHREEEANNNNSNMTSRTPQQEDCKTRKSTKQCIAKQRPNKQWEQQ